MGDFMDNERRGSRPNLAIRNLKAAQPLIGRDRNLGKVADSYTAVLADSISVAVMRLER